MKCFRYETIDSTNLQARRLWEELASPDEPYAVLAGEQTAGLGRLGRTWQSPVGGLWLTLAWPARQPLHQYQALPLAAGHALASLLANHYNLPALIKWPNDVLVRGRKIAGILCQSQASPRPPCILVGIGVNGNYPASDIVGETRCPSTTLLDELGEPVDLAQFGRQFLNVLESTLNDFEDAGLRNMVEPLKRRLAWIGETVCGFDGGEAPVTGELVGIDDQGRLLMKSQGVTRAWVSGELQQLATASNGSCKNMDFHSPR